MNSYVCDLISWRNKLEKVPSRPNFSYLSGNFSSSMARFYECLMMWYYKSISQLFGFKQLIRTPTRITNDTESLSNIIASNNCSYIKETTVVPCGIADHKLIGCVKKLSHMKFPEKTIKCRGCRSYDPPKPWTPARGWLELNL